MLTTGSGRLIRKKMMRRAQKGRKEGKISGKWKGDLPIDCWLRFSQSFLFPFFSFFLFPLFFLSPTPPLLRHGRTGMRIQQIARLGTRR